MSGPTTGALPLPPKVPPTVKVILRICFAIGGAFVVGALILAVREWRFIATSDHATATVSRIDREWMSGSNRSNGSSTGGNWGYRVVAAFPGSDGRRSEVRSTSLTSYTGYRVGDSIGVDYPVGRPEQAQLVRFVDRWMLELVLGGIGAVALGIAAFATWLLRQPGTRITTNGIGGFSVQSASVSVEREIPRPAQRDVAKDAARRDGRDAVTSVSTRPGWMWIAIVLLVGVAIGVAAAHFDQRGAAANSSAQGAVAGSGKGFRDNTAVSGGDAPAPGYPSNLTVKTPPMSDPMSDTGSDTGSWTDPANGGSTPANLTMAARAFLARPAQDAAMQGALRGQVARLGLDCPAITFAPGETLVLAKPAPLFDPSGALLRGLIRQRFVAHGCSGRSPEFNIWVFAPGDGAPVRTVAGFPGTTRADLSLLQDATPIALGIASRLAPGCRTLMVSDTHLPSPPPRDAGSPWSEQWLIAGCGKQIALTVKFIPDATRGMTRIEVPDTMARLLAPQ